MTAKTAFFVEIMAIYAKREVGYEVRRSVLYVTDDIQTDMIERSVRRRMEHET